jgi:hypothetical protein
MSFRLRFGRNKTGGTAGVKVTNCCEKIKKMIRIMYRSVSLVVSRGKNKVKNRVVKNKAMDRRRYSGFNDANLL